MSAAAATGRAEALAARLPPLLLAAERVAATVAQGVHGRRRVGQGDSFWQFRPFSEGDPRSRIDWRQSAKSHRVYVRETEWEAAQTCFLWRDASASMRWHSARNLSDKRARAELLLLALAALLLKAGERVRLLDSGPLAGGAASLAGLAEALDRAPASGSANLALPDDAPLPRFARIVMFGDFLAPLGEIRAMITRLAAVPVAGFLVQTLDPAERALPYGGRMRFLGLEGEPAALIPRVEAVREAYQHRLAAQIAGIADLARAARFGFFSHTTDQPPETALLALYTALA